MAGKTRPEGYPLIQESEKQSRYQPSASFITSISVILGVIISVGLIVWVIGGAFWVTRQEYTEKNLKDIEMTTTFHSTLNQLKETMTLQAANFKELTNSVEKIRLDMATSRR